MSRVFVDTNVPMYAAGGPHPLREPARRVVLALAGGQLDGSTDAEVFQEILYRYLRAGERAAGFAVFDNFHRVMLGRVFPVDVADVRSARDLAERHTSLSPRDLVHLAVMLRHQIPAIVTADTGFDTVPEIRRLDLMSFVAPT